MRRPSRLTSVAQAYEENMIWSQSLPPVREVAASRHFETGQKLDIALLAPSGSPADAGFLI